MLRILYATLIPLFATHYTAAAQERATEDPGGGVALLPTAVRPSSAASQIQTDKAPIAALTFGYIYLAPETAPDTFACHNHGFFGIQQVNFKPWLAAIADFTQDYNTGRNAHENIQSILAGPLFTARSKAKVSYFAFADAGRVRDSKAGTISNEPSFAVGGGLTYKVNKHLALLIVPGEYVRSWQPTGPYHSLGAFTARFGFTLPLYK